MIRNLFNYNFINWKEKHLPLDITKKDKQHNYNNINEEKENKSTF